MSNTGTPLKGSYNGSAKPVIIEALTAQLEDLHDALAQLSDEQFQTTFVFKTNPEKIRASVGQHTRHVIEFVDTLLKSINEDLVNYDFRDRNKDIETSIDTAQMTLKRLQQRLSGITNQDLQRPIQMVEAVDVERDSDPANSTVAREIYFAISHTEHHFALINERCDALGVALPADFGKAVSTRRSERRMAPQ